MQITREWATPLTIGTFILMACTGILMFFHLDTGLNKEAHEWLGWAMVVGVAAHVIANWGAFSRHLARKAALGIIGVFVALLAGSFFVQEEGGGGHPAQRTAKAVLKAPLRAVAPLAGQSPEALIAKLREAGFKVESADQALSSVTGPQPDAQFKALAVVFP